MCHHKYRFKIGLHFENGQNSHITDALVDSKMGQLSKFLSLQICSVPRIRKAYKTCMLYQGPRSQFPKLFVSSQNFNLKVCSAYPIDFRFSFHSFMKKRITKYPCELPARQVYLPQIPSIISTEALHLPNHINNHVSISIHSYAHNMSDLQIGIHT